MNQFLPKIYPKYLSPLHDLVLYDTDHVVVSCLAWFDAIFEHYYEPYFK